MKKFIRLGYMALMAIVASVIVTSCSKSDDEGGFSPSALGVVYGFTDVVMDNYDLKFTYTDENGKTVSEDIKKEQTEVTDTIIRGEKYSYYQWEKAVVFNKSLTSGEAYVTATKKANYAIKDDGRYTWLITQGCAAVKANTKKMNIMRHAQYGKNAQGSKFNDIIQSAISTTRKTYTVGSNGTLTVK